MRYVGANLPPAYVEAMDQWRLAQDDRRLTRGDALEYFVAKGLGAELPTFEGRPRPASQAEIDERGERFCQLYAELGSYAAVAREVSLSVERVRQVIARYERVNRT
ncbi:MAG TPA: hypothetical protein VI168_00845 [Croceibacterium sp.]